MAHRLKTLAKTLHDAANEAEKCCEYQKEIDILRIAVRNENSLLSRKTEDMADKEKELKAALVKEQKSSITQKRLEESLRKQNAQLERTVASKTKLTADLITRIGSLRKELQEMTDKEKEYKAALAEEKENSSKIKQRLEENLSKQNAVLESIQKARNNDVSDKLRPKKVAEIYQELYDNEWSDAYEMLDTLGLQEDKAIETLSQVLKHVMEYCKKRSKQQNSGLHQNLMLTEKQVNGELSDPIPRHLEYCKKELSSVTIETLYEMYISNADEARDSGVRDVLKIKSFVKECIRACWLCVIQHPPMHIVFEANAHGSPFNTDVYRHYTKTGSQVDYIVWPPLLLYENGPVLTKGVAQGTEKSPLSYISKQKVTHQNNASVHSAVVSNTWNLSHTQSSPRRKTPDTLLHVRRNAPQKQYGYFRGYVSDRKPTQIDVHSSEQCLASKCSVKLSKSRENIDGATSIDAHPRRQQKTDKRPEATSVYTHTFREITKIRESRSQSAERKYRDMESDLNRSLPRITRSKSGTDLSHI